MVNESLLATREIRAVPGQPGTRRFSPLVRTSPAADDDYFLARAVANGDINALGDLYQRHHRQVYGVCLSMTRNPAEAEDLTQDVFVHLVRKIGSYRGESRFSTWLHRLTINLVLMHMRRPSRREQP